MSDTRTHNNYFVGDICIVLTTVMPVKMLLFYWLLNAHTGWPASLGMMTSSNGNIFLVTGPLCGEFTSPGDFPAQRPVTRGFDVFFDLRPNKRLSKQWLGWWSETPSSPLWRHCNGQLSIPCDLTSFEGNAHLPYIPIIMFALCHVLVWSISFSIASLARGTILQWT